MRSTPSFIWRVPSAKAETAFVFASFSFLIVCSTFCPIGAGNLHGCTFIAFRL